MHVVHMPAIIQMIAPRVKTYLRKLGRPCYTDEGVCICSKIEDLDIGYINRMLLLSIPGDNDQGQSLLVHLGQAPLHS